MGTMKEILALHGWTTSIDKWGPFLDSLKGGDIRLKIPPIPGLTKKINRAWALKDYVDWLKQFVGNRKIILMGHSNGGRIAIAFTTKYPNCVSKLILIDSAGIYHNERSLKLKRVIFQGIAKIGKKVTTSENLRKFLYKLTGESDYKNADALQRQIMINMISQDLTPILKKVSMPTLIIWGQNDKTTPLSDGRLMRKLIPNSELKIISGAKHSPHYTNPKEVAKIINEYL